MLCASFTHFSLLSPKGCPMLCTKFADLWTYGCCIHVHCKAGRSLYQRYVTHQIVRCYYHWTVLFDLVSYSIYVRFNERYSSDPKAESVPTSVRQCATVVLTQLLQSCPSCYHMLMFMYCLPRLFEPKKSGWGGDGSQSCSSTLNKIWW